MCKKEISYPEMYSAQANTQCTLCKLLSYKIWVSVWDQNCTCIISICGVRKIVYASKKI